jgi:hypothetical protein
MKPIKTETIRKGWNSETIKHTFRDRTSAVLFFYSLEMIEPIGEWKELFQNTVTVFTCSAD